MFLFLIVLSAFELTWFLLFYISEYKMHLFMNEVMKQIMKRTLFCKYHNNVMELIADRSK